MAALYAFVRVLVTLAHCLVRWRYLRADDRLKAAAKEMDELEAAVNRDAGVVMPAAQHMLRAAKQAQRLQVLDESKEAAASKALRLERWEGRLAWLRARAATGGHVLPYLLGHADTAAAIFYHPQLVEWSDRALALVMALTGKGG